MTDGPTRVAVIGFGAIGRSVAQQLLDGRVRGCELVALLVRATRDEVPRALMVQTLEELQARLPDVVVEAAGHEVVRCHGRPLLESGCDFVCVSVGALADPGLRRQLEQAAKSGGARLVVPSGAVGALDLLRAAARGGLEDVFVEQRKPPIALLPDEPEISYSRELFAGSAADAAALFPTTMNIVAAVALAGIGFERTRCRVVADPDVSGARVLVRAQGAFGRLDLSMDLAPSSNPQTSAITAMSVAATLEAISAPMAMLP